jgi:hypothetical protein
MDQRQTHQGQNQRDVSATLLETSMASNVYVEPMETAEIRHTVAMMEQRREPREGLRIDASGSGMEARGT